MHRKLFFTGVAVACSGLSFAGGPGDSLAYWTFTYDSDGNKILAADGTIYVGPNAKAAGDTAAAGTIDALGAPLKGGGLLYDDMFAPTPGVSPGGYKYDDQFEPGKKPVLTPFGLLFTIGNTEVNICSIGPDNYQFSDSNGFSVDGTFSAQTVPGPPATAVVLSAFGLAVRRRIGRKPFA